MSDIIHKGHLIIEKIKEASKIDVRNLQKQLSQTSEMKSVVQNTAFLRNDVFIAMGASTGGTEALRAVLTQWPAEIPPVVIVQHIPPVFSAAFARRLNDLCPFEVREAKNGDELKPGLVLIAPGGQQMKVVKKGVQFAVEINDDDPVNRHKPSVDYLFDSVVNTLGRKAICIILTGMGGDGARGMLKLKELGCHTIAQNEASSVVFGMPREAIKLGAAKQILPLDEIAAAIMKKAA